MVFACFVMEWIFRDGLVLLPAIHCLVLVILLFGDFANVK